MTSTGSLLPTHVSYADDPGGQVLQPGEELLPGYRVVQLLRRGRRLDVYDVWSEARAARCVVKVVLPDRRDEPHVVADLLREGELLLRLDHPHWVRAYEVHEQPFAAVVLETLGGHTLGALLDDTPRLRPADVVLLGAQVASALRYLHAQGVLHLDLTPGNVVVEAGRARLIDLSLASAPGPVEAGSGTTGYRAPEVLRGWPATTATDVHALGTLLAECLSGVSPDDESTDLAYRPRMRDRLRRDVPPGWLLELVAACRADDAAERPSLDEVLAVLTHTR